LVLGLDRLETASFLRSNGTFQYLTGLPSFPDPQTLRRLHQAPDSFLEQMHRMNDRVLQNFIHLPEHRSRWIFDLDSSVVTVFGRQEHAEMGYHPRYRGKRSYRPLLCIEANSSYFWDTELRLSKNLAKPVYTSPPSYQEVAREYTFLKWRKSEVLGAKDAPERDRPPLS